MRPFQAPSSERGDILQTHWALLLAQHLCRGGGKEVFFVIFKRLEPLIQTSEAMPPSTPRALGISQAWSWGWTLSGGFTWVLPGCPRRPPAGLRPLSHPDTQHHGEGDGSPGAGLGPLLAGTQDIPPLIWRAEHPTSGNLTTSGAGGGKFFTFLPDVWQ